MVRTLHVVFRLNFYKKYMFKRYLENFLEVKMQPQGSNMRYALNSKDHYLLNLTSSSLKVTFLEEAITEDIEKLEQDMIRIINKRFKNEFFLIEKRDNLKVNIIEV